MASQATSLISCFSTAGDGSWRRWGDPGRFEHGELVAVDRFDLVVVPRHAAAEFRLATTGSV
jgi:hypothetical protein